MVSWVKKPISFRWKGTQEGKEKQNEKTSQVLYASTIRKEEEVMHSKDPLCSNSVLLQVKKIMESKSFVDQKVK